MRMILFLVVLASCGETVPDSPSKGELASCGANEVQDLIGRPLNGLRDRFPASARIIPFGAPITEDFSLERLNVNLDNAKTITRIWCG